MAAARGHYASGIARQEQIVEAALELFATNGYRATSIRDLAARVGISHSGLLRYFPTKEGLLLAVLDERDRRERLMFVGDIEDPLHAARSIVELAEHNARTRGLVQLYTVIAAEATDSGHPAHEYFRDRFRRVRANIEAHFVQLQTLELLRGGVDPHSTAIDLLALSDGLQLQWLIDPERVDLVRELTRFLQSLVTFDLSADGPGHPSE